MCRPIRRVHMSMRTEGIKAFSKRIRRCSVDGRKRYENDKCGRKSVWKRSKKASFSFENGLVWTGPYSLTLIISCLVTFFTFFAASYHQVRAILVAESSSQDGSFLLGPRAPRQSWKKVSRHFGNTLVREAVTSLALRNFRKEIEGYHTILISIQKRKTLWQRKGNCIQFCGLHTEKQIPLFWI